MNFASTDASHYEPYDIGHVYMKFPQASRGTVERLGKAISWRRGYFKYREAHHSKLAQGLDFDSGKTEIVAQSTVASLLPQNMKIAGESRPALEAVDEDEHSNIGVSQTSYATSEADPGRLQCPPLRKSLKTDHSSVLTAT